MNARFLCLHSTMEARLVQILKNERSRHVMATSVCLSLTPCGPIYSLFTVWCCEHRKIAFRTESGFPPTVLECSVLNHGVIVAGMKLRTIGCKCIAHLVYKTNHSVMLEFLRAFRIHFTVIGTGAVIARALLREFLPLAVVVLYE